MGLRALEKQICLTLATAWTYLLFSNRLMWVQTMQTGGKCGAFQHNGMLVGNVLGRCSSTTAEAPISDFEPQQRPKQPP